MQLADGTRVACKRKGLKITLTVGTKKGEGLRRRLDVSMDPVLMLNAALQEAAKARAMCAGPERAATVGCWHRRG